ncbi:hypothetical protein KJ567_07415 [Candidatus Bipolaricaulota bacterium]|nr:hypothetical protein [Candidatus Bipolaricaulota bacterium]
MGHTMLKAKKRLVCPACAMAVYFRPAADGLGTCPHCGEWLVESGQKHRQLERLEYEAGTAFDDSDEWVRALSKEIK